MKFVINQDGTYINMENISTAKETHGMLRLAMNSGGVVDIENSDIKKQILEIINNHTMK